MKFKILFIVLVSIFVIDCNEKSATLYSYIGGKKEKAIRFYGGFRDLERCLQYRKYYCSCDIEKFPPECDLNKLNNCNAVCEID